MFEVFSRLIGFSGFLDRKQLEQDGCSGSTFTDTDQFIFIATGLFMPAALLAFATGIISMGFKLFYTAITRVFEQSIAIAIAVLLLHTHFHPRANCYCGSWVKLRQ